MVGVAERLFAAVEVDAAFGSFIGFDLSVEHSKDGGEFVDGSRNGSAKRVGRRAGGGARLGNRQRWFEVAGGFGFRSGHVPIIGLDLERAPSCWVVIIATKGRFDPPQGSAGGSRRSLVRSVDASLDRLGIAAIDLYFVHGWDQHTPVVETLDALASLVRCGKIHSIGWSNVTGWQLGRILTEAEHGGLIAPCVMQPQYNLLDRGIELEVLPCCLDHAVSITPWSPLGGGWLTGKYSRDERPTGTSRLGDDPNRGVEAYDGRNTERTWKILDAVQATANRHERSMGQVAIAWLLQRPSVSSVLLGARTVDQLRDNLGAITLELTAQEVADLAVVSAPGLPPYPYAMIEEFCDVPHWRELGTSSV